ncbi:hypothetical protein SCHPADRAFT_892161 [Schizopora paradoxa]|uniref:Uncharacterized protein n=1 Tax=Schizopora paradoxa TaxID=27342 RepID=A0A0H2RFQ7_9AGAM|nr:hypothetical protein SCHPADRAFT_892161 [Schizopora paradoxa]
MVKLHILSSTGNQNSRFFPYTGYLGLTPLRVEGVVRTKLEQDRKPILASSIVVSVKCVESRIGRFGVSHSNVLAEYSVTLWSATAAATSSPSSPVSPTVQYAELGDSEHPFRIVVPADTLGHSSLNFQDYKISWRVEAVATHAPIFGVGTRIVRSYELPLIRYDARTPTRTPPLPSPDRFLTVAPPSSNRVPLVRYQILTPTHPVGPMDIVTIPLTLIPLDPHVHVRSVSLLVERRIELAETAALPSPAGMVVASNRPDLFSDSTIGSQAESTSSGSTVRPESQITVGTEDTFSTVRGFAVEDRPGAAGSAEAFGPASSMATFSTASLLSSPAPSSTASLLPHHPLAAPSPASVPNANTTDLPAKSIVSNVASVDAPGPFPRGPLPADLDGAVEARNGAVVRTLTLQWPALKSHAHWAMGETMQTDMVRVRFYIKTKVIVSSPTSPACTLELEERELFLISTNDSERGLAREKYRAEQDVRRQQRSQSRSSHHSKSSANLKRHTPSSRNLHDQRSVPELPGARSAASAGPSGSKLASSSLSSFSHSPSPSPCPSPSPSISTSPSPGSSRDADIDRYGVRIPPVPKSAEPVRSFFRTSSSSKEKGRDAKVKVDKGKGKARADAPAPSTSFRRPHTATGARNDSSNRPAGSAQQKPKTKEQLDHPPLGYIASSWGLSSSSNLNQWAAKSKRPSSSGASMKRPSTSSGRPSAAPSSPAVDAGTVRDWEEELARIEKTSKRVSVDMRTVLSSSSNTSSRNSNSSVIAPPMLPKRASSASAYSAKAPSTNTTKSTASAGSSLSRKISAGISIGAIGGGLSGMFLRPKSSSGKSKNKDRSGTSTSASASESS